MSEPGSANDHTLSRRFLLTATGAAAAVGLTQALPRSADAATGTTAWLLGGNAGVTSDGTNFIGPTNPAPIIFKTKASSTASLSEKVRIDKTGRVGVGIPNPTAKLEVLGSATSPAAIKGSNPNISTSSAGVQGEGASGYGVSGRSTNNFGVYGRGDSYGGVYGEGPTYGGAFVSTGSGYGVYGSGSTGVYGSGSSNGLYGSGSTYGVYGSGSTGVYGSGSTGVTGNGGSVGVHGQNASNSGVRGDSTYVGVWGSGTSWGLYAIANDTVNQVYGVYGQTVSPAGFGLFSQGNAHVNGTLSKTAGAFKIDHPLDPENMWLSHSFVESPDMMNIYNGNVTLDSTGAATVELPSYFTALNQEYRYQLTPIGQPGGDLHIASELQGNSFAIGGGAPGMKVSWQVTGIRHDDYAREHPIVVETNKSKAERGTREFVPKNSNARLMKRGPVPAKRDN
jgi:hypothetical protein